jgi:Protein of unknown function (DUF3237)
MAGGTTLLSLESELLCEIRAELEEPQDLGTTPFGKRLIIYVKGGSFEGPRRRGEVLPGGGDWVLVRLDAVRQLDVPVTLRTDDGRLIYMSHNGLLDVSPAVFQRLLRSEPIDPAEYYFRTTPRFETASEKSGWLNRIVTVGRARRTATGMVDTVYAIR